MATGSCDPVSRRASRQHLPTTPLLLQVAFGGRRNFAENRRFEHCRKPKIGVRHLRSVTCSSALVWGGGCYYHLPKHMCSLFQVQVSSWLLDLPPMGFRADRTVSRATLAVPTMRAEIVAYMIYLEGSEYPEYVMHAAYH